MSDSWGWSSPAFSLRTQVVTVKEHLLFVLSIGRNMASLVKELQALHRHREDLSFTPAVFLCSAQAAHPPSSSSSVKAAEQMELPDDLWGGLGWLE